MIIGLLLDDTLDTSDGVQQYVLTLGEWLESKNHEVHYIVGLTTRKDKSNIHSMTKNIKVNFNKNRMSIPLPVRTKAIATLFDKVNFDVIHVQMPYSPQFAARIIRKCPNRTAIVGTFHILPFARLERLATRGLGVLLARNLRRLTKVIAVSEPASVFLKQSFKLKSEVIPNPVNLARYKTIQLDTRDSGYRLVFVGRLVERKGIMQLLKGYRVLLEQNPGLDVHLDICGDGPLRIKVDSFIALNNLKAHTTLHGFITESKKIEILSKARIAVFPSTGGESFGIVLIEAMAAGAGVVIGGNNDGYKSVLQNPITIFDPNDDKKLAKLIYNYLTDSKDYNQIHIEQQELVKQFNIDRVGPKILSEYSQAIAKVRISDNNKKHEYIS